MTCDPSEISSHRQRCGYVESRLFFLNPIVDVNCASATVWTRSAWWILAGDFLFLGAILGPREKIVPVIAFGVLSLLYCWSSIFRAIRVEAGGAIRFCGPIRRESFDRNDGVAFAWKVSLCSPLNARSLRLYDLTADKPTARRVGGFLVFSGRKHLLMSKQLLDLGLFDYEKLSSDGPTAR